MAVKVTLDGPAVELGRAQSVKDASFTVEDEGGGKLGELVISKGGVRWRPAKKPKKQKDGLIPWDKFIDLMNQR